MKGRSFEDLEVFRRAYRISLEVHRFSLGMPAAEQRGLADQLRRSSKSICANIAEGHGKQTSSKADFRRFLSIAIGSTEETRVWLRYCFDLGYLDQGTYETWRDEYQEIVKMVSGLHRHAI